jgi:hypothetical protein
VTQLVDMKQERDEREDLVVKLQVLRRPPTLPQPHPHRLHRPVAHPRRSTSAHGDLPGAFELVEVLSEVGTSGVEFDAEEGREGVKEGEDGVVLDRVDGAGVVEVESKERGREEGLQAVKVGKEDMDGFCERSRGEKVSPVDLLRRLGRCDDGRTESSDRPDERDPLRIELAGVVSLRKLGEVSSGGGDTRSAGDEEAGVEVGDRNGLAIRTLNQDLDLLDSVDRRQLLGELLGEAAVSTNDELEGRAVLVSVLVVPRNGGSIRR